MGDPEDEDDHSQIWLFFMRSIYFPSLTAYVVKSAKFSIYGSDYYHGKNWCKAIPDFDDEDYYKFREEEKEYEG